MLSQAVSNDCPQDPQTPQTLQPKHENVYISLQKAIYPDILDYIYLKMGVAKSLYGRGTLKIERIILRKFALRVSKN